MIDIFDEFGNWIGVLKPKGGGFEAFLFSITIFIALSFLFVVYALFKTTFLGLVCLFKGDFRNSVSYLIFPTAVLLIVLMLIAAGGLVGLMDYSRNKSIDDEAAWAMLNPNLAFTILKVGENSWTIENNLNQSVETNVISGDCMFSYILPVDNEKKEYLRIYLRPNDVVLMECEYIPSTLTLWSHEKSWTKLSEFELQNYK